LLFYILHASLGKREGKNLHVQMDMLFDAWIELPKKAKKWIIRSRKPVGKDDPWMKWQ